ncbi:BQ2448_2305 [Microbotryum intermedium]|uniref:BQ2448_2305 protein n=1 Tax=Microbotryum intermedium TaxID=269621 RepID=A0A238F7W0_9BASI|nr:BQ2448_2305 [Microbotryum intermedium]
MATSSPPWIAQLWSWVESNGGQCKLAELREIRPGERALVATHTVPPSKPIVSIPLRLLCNKLTLAPLYPAHIAQSLTSTQFISLHLALQAATTEESFPVPCGRTRLTAPREFFRPFEQSLPTRFDSLPLTWELMASSSSELRDRFEIDAADKTLHGPSQSMSADLLSCLPPSLLVRTDDVIKRFEVDWKRCKTVWDGYLATNIDETDRLRFQAFHIAWCNVNTRCLYYDLGLPLTENLTLCPIIDMINHRSSRTTQPQGRFSSFSFSSPPVASTSEESYRQGDELVFSYGAHANALLMAEYGFSLGVTNPDNNNLDVSAYIEQLLLDDPQGSVKRDLLEAEGYWGDWTIQVDSNFSDETSYPSFRTLIALRLLHIERLDRETAALQSWHDVISGLLDVVSARNEAQVEHSLLHIVSRVDDECVQMLEMCQKLMRKYARPDDDVAVSARHCLSMLHGIVECDRSTASRLRFK